MATWRLNPALTALRTEVNAEYPNRDKGSDGTIGDAAHQSGASDHNPDADGSVDAWDMDVNLHGSDKPPPVREIEELKRLFQSHPASLYWIHNGRIASRDNAWRRVPYSGANPHDKHVHWNTRHGHENNTAPWEVGVITEQEIAKIAAATAKAVHNQRLGSSAITFGAAVQTTHALVQQIAKEVAIDATELASIQATVEKGVTAAADEFAAAVVANLPAGSLTKGDVEDAVRAAFERGLAPDG